MRVVLDFSIFFENSLNLNWTNGHVYIIILSVQKWIREKKGGENKLAKMTRNVYKKKKKDLRALIESRFVEFKCHKQTKTINTHCTHI